MIGDPVVGSVHCHDTGGVQPRAHKPDGEPSGHGWSSADDAAVPGDPFWNLERPASAGQRAATTMGGLFGAIVAAFGGISRSVRRPETVRTTPDGVVIASRAGKRTVGWDEVERSRYVEQRDEGQGSPVVVLELKSGEVVALPDSLYPDAVGLFSSRRHTERARSIADSINSDLEVFSN